MEIIDRWLQTSIIVLVLVLTFIVVSLTRQVSTLQKDINMVEQRVGIIEYNEMYEDGEYDED